MWLRMEMSFLSKRERRSREGMVITVLGMAQSHKVEWIRGMLSIMRCHSN